MKLMDKNEYAIKRAARVAAELEKRRQDMEEAKLKILTKVQAAMEQGLDRCELEFLAVYFDGRANLVSELAPYFTDSGFSFEIDRGTGTIQDELVWWITPRGKSPGGNFTSFEGR